MPESARGKERFIPVTRFALLDRLTAPTAWPAGQGKEARRFFRYLDHWRRQQYNAQLNELEETYEPFSPDSDLLMTRAFTPDERAVMQARVIDGMTRILNQANYVRIDHNDVEQILTRESAYGLDLQVDLDVFEEVLLFYRGASSKRDNRRRWQKFYLREQFDIPLFQRLFLLFKLKPTEKRVLELMQTKKLSRREAEKLVKRERDGMPPEVKENCIYMKLFKNIPRSDLEMIFPNTRVRFRFFDKLRLGATAGGGLGLGLFGAAGKIALLATNPIAALGAMVGLGGIAFRQSVNFMNQKQRYMVVMAQNLYFHAMADNRGVMLKLAARAAEEDIKEEMLLYSVLTKENARRQDIPDIDAAIEQYLAASFGVSVDFDISDALERLIGDGLVVEHPDGRLEAKQPKDAAQHIDKRWDAFLDELPEPVSAEGMEFEGGEPPLSAADGVRHCCRSAAEAQYSSMTSTKLSVRTTDLGVAQAISDALTAAEPALDAVTLFEDGAGAWRIEAYAQSRADAQAAAEALRAEKGRPIANVALEDLPDLNWVAISQAALPPVIAGRFVVHGSHDRGRIPLWSGRHCRRCRRSLRHGASRDDPRLPSRHRQAGARGAISPRARPRLRIGRARHRGRALHARRASDRHRFRSHRGGGGARQRRRQRRPPHRHRLCARPRPPVAAACGALRPDHRQHPRRPPAHAGRQRFPLAAPRRQRHPLRHPQSGGRRGDRRLRRPRFCPHPAPPHRRMVDADAAQAALGGASCTCAAKRIARAGQAA